MNDARVRGQQSVRRALDVLFCLEAAIDSDRPAMTAADLAARLRLNRTTTWRYLQALTEAGLVCETGDGRFALGARTVSLAEAYTRQWGELEAVAGAALVRLRDVTGETAALHLRQGWSRIVVRQAESRHELHRTYRELGRPISLLAGAPSRAILASLSPQELDAYRRADPAAGTAWADPGVLVAELEEVRRCGFAVSRGSRVPGVTSVAAPLREASGHVVGAVNVTGPAYRLTDDGLPLVADAVTAAARWVEDQMRDPSR